MTAFSIRPTHRKKTGAPHNALRWEDRPARLESAFFLERLKFVFLGLRRLVAGLGFVCLLGAILVRGLFLPLIV
jgi:hypothetical protein